VVKCIGEAERVDERARASSRMSLAKQRSRAQDYAEGGLHLNKYYKAINNTHLTC